MEHFLVMTHDVDGTRDFYRDVLGFQEGFRPDLGFLGHWLYLGDTPVIHIADWSTYTAHSNRLGIPVTQPLLEPARWITWPSMGRTSTIRNCVNVWTSRA